MVPIARTHNIYSRTILNEWARFLSSPESVGVLSATHDGWLSKQALDAMARVASDGSSHPKSFEEVYICDPSQPHHGFKSWDDFFTRQFLPGVRPIASADNASIILSACESRPLRIARQVKFRDRFWLKSQPYSLTDMLAGDEYTDTFVNGTIYQAFLNALSYHRWHSLVSGIVIKIHHEPGTYYAEDYWEGFGKSGKYPHPPALRHTLRLSHSTGHEPDPSGPNKSQEYLSEVATRAVIYIRADDPSIGLICALFIGIAEVSSCDVTVKTGQHVMRGDEIGMFHYGGSTYYLLFQGGGGTRLCGSSRS